MPYARRNLKKKGPKVSLSQNNGLKWRKGTAVVGPLKVDQNELNLKRRECGTINSRFVRTMRRLVW